MLTFIKKFATILTPAEKWRIGLILLCIFVGGCLEVLGIGVVLPYLALLINPQKINSIQILQNSYQLLQNQHIINSTNGFFIILTLSIIAVYWLKNGFLIFNQSFQTRFTYGLYQKLSTNLFDYYLHEDYQSHLNKNTSELIRNINQLTFDLITTFLLPLLMLISEMVIVVLLVTFLLMMNPLSTLYVFILLGAIVSFIFLKIRKKLHESGQTVGELQTLSNKQVLQGLGSFKSTTLLHKQSFFVAEFGRAVRQISQHRSYFEVMQNLPRFFMETAVVTVMLSLAIMMLYLRKPSSDLILTLSVFGMAGMRLLPSMNRILNSLNSIKWSQSMMQGLLDDLQKIEKSQDSQMTVLEPFEFDTLNLENISFAYENGVKVLNDISLTLKAGQSIGFVGHSGSGKSTLVDVILGLLTPQTGTISVNQQPLRQILATWQQGIGYIPQDIYLSDESIRANIAFGVSANTINEQQLWYAIHTAQLERLIHELPEGLDTVIGERGVKLSGGQRQRIGIARALYHNPQILVMDEATAALDNVTERAFMSAVNGLKGQKTLLMIAHRLSTVENCDMIYFMDNGKIVDSGRYEELLQRNPHFQHMVGSLEM